MKVSCTLLLRPEAKGHVILHDWLVTHAHGQLVTWLGLPLKVRVKVKVRVEVRVIVSVAREN